MTEVVEFVEEVCGIYFRSILLPKRGMMAAQHVHTHDHATLVCSGAARLFVNGKGAGLYRAGQAVPIVAGSRHSFLALSDNTRLACVHVAASAESAKEKELAVCRG